MRKVYFFEENQKIRIITPNYDDYCDGENHSETIDCVVIKVQKDTNSSRFNFFRKHL